MRAVVIVCGLLLVGAATAMVGAYILAGQANSQLNAPSRARSYAGLAATALADADPAQGDELIANTACGACHEASNERIAPSFQGIASRAASRLTALSAEAYLYQSITEPRAFVAPGYAQSMPLNYGQRLTQAEIGHIIAHLLTLTGSDDS